MQERMKNMISVIVPVYNCEKYLIDSINSIVNQTIFKDLEVIFVDDGSVDNSLKILKEYEAKFNNIQVFHQENKGVSAARNLGVRKAKGEYIAFFDADDIARPQLYEKLLCLIEEYHVEISVVDYSMVFDDGTEKKHRTSTVQVLTDHEEILEQYLRNGLICTNPVDKMFKAELVKTILFPEGYAIGEDMYFLYQVLKRANSIVIDSSESLYLYQLRNNSAMKRKFDERFFDSVKLSKMMAEDMRNSRKLAFYGEANYIHEICKMLCIYYINGIDEHYIEVKNYLKDLNNYSYRKAFRYMNKKHFIALVLMRLSPSFYIKVYRFSKIG